MSRFVGIIQENRRMDLNHVKKILQETKEKLEADSAFVMMNFEYFIEKLLKIRIHALLANSAKDFPF